MTTYCTECDNRHPETVKQEPWRWRCLAVPTAPGYGYVSPDYSPTPPYQLCKFVNTEGACPHFEAARRLETVE